MSFPEASTGMSSHFPNDTSGFEWRLNGHI
jgi:hypothetical protein